MARWRGNGSLFFVWHETRKDRVTRQEAEQFRQEDEALRKNVEAGREAR